MKANRARLGLKCSRLSLRSRGKRNLSHVASTSTATSQKPFYVTSPIFYVNAAPHIGHLYSTVVADIFARWEKLRNPSRSVFFTTGTDEHGLKIQQAASARNMTPLQLSDITSQQFRDLAKASRLASTAFIRTTGPAHAKAVENIWRRLVQNGYIYKGVHSGWYAVSDEAFYTASQVETVEDPTTGNQTHRSKETGKEVVWTDEENYKFRLSEFRLPLKEWIEKTSPIVPRQRQEEILDNLSEEGSVQDLSVSRLRSRVEWGLQVPDDPLHTVYVWLDALTSYMTAVGLPWDRKADMRAAGWPADIHVVGKDILRFHAIYFPAFLMALNLPLPESILCHAHWTLNRQKMSKSVGNVVDPFEVLGKYGIDSVRWYLARNGKDFASDVDWTPGQLEILHDRDLKGLGNLYRRLHAPSLCDGSRFALPSSSSSEDSLERELTEALVSVSGEVTDMMKSKAVSRALDVIMARVELTNRYLTIREPWKEDDPTRRGRALALGRESLRICGILLQPFLPTRIPLLLDWLRVPGEQRGLVWASYGAVSRVGGFPATPEQMLYNTIK